ncbi:MAG: transcription-repair coupling factor (superfamily II helicase) [Gammaproteobacteria bacterium]|nr:MAG: transcription-repair coupling factor (superfamily II helicase) [Gammaproteobacteria bacterium]TND07001.1 MAG: transcription-repair coupling factor (superfamily II helicase) [Gammaproteobacteria bacterium]
MPDTAVTADASEPRASPLAPPLPSEPGDRIAWGRLYGSSDGLVVAMAAHRHHAPVVLITADARTSARVTQEIEFFNPDPQNLPLLTFPDWETLPYDAFSPHQDIVSERLASLYRLPRLTHGMLVVSVTTAMHRLLPHDYLDRSSLMLDVGEKLDPTAMRDRFTTCGYRCVSQVMEHGEFAVRGNLVDLFPMGSDIPYRIDLFDDEVESIRAFDPETQRSMASVASVRLLPAREFPLDEAAVARFREHYRATFEGDPQRSIIYRDVSNGIAPAGIEYYLPLFFDNTATLFDYLPRNTLFIISDGAREAADQFWRDAVERYEQHRLDPERPPLPPQQIYLQSPEFFQLAGTLPRVALGHFELEKRAGFYNMATRAVPTLTIQHRAAEPAAALTTFLKNFDGRVLFAAESAGRRETLLELLRQYRVHPAPFERWQAFLDSSAPVGITVAALENGLMLEDPSIAVIAEVQLFGEQAMQRRRRKARTRDSDAVVRNLTELEIGAPVVHEDYGVGRYQGLQILDVGGSTTEFLTLTYADGDKLYVPVASLHLISRYTGASPEHAPLHRLGGEQWQRAKRRAAERVRDVAAELLDIYARRAARSGHAFPVADDEYAGFSATFPFEETPDQQSAIDAVLADMRREQPMDRLVCGDVGFGKTEVAMRAAFVATQGGKQVAVLVPTTLLAQQHFQNFQDRFADWPVRIDLLSRFRSRKEQAAVLQELEDGRLDIVIGTHKLLQENVRFARLGLVILDEEHRFGVRQKERMKALRSEVDVLTLTATPIPRTLNMALSGIRDLSIIATPPAHRLAIKTFVSEWNDPLIREAILREIRRGGQVYFLHNQVESIENTARKLAQLVPEVEIRVAHGQMRERDLERVMLDFYHQRFNVLVCSTIIESGIDIPTANTIIINRADRLGLAQLYQLRGRVGRSHHRAYAYLLVPPRNAMTADAIKRLEAIESLEELGAGFMLATHDLEIRGAGELLGDEQSGQMHEIGFTLYTQLLERAVAALKSGQQPDLDKPLAHGAEVDLGIPALITADYLPDVHSRLVMYKRIANAASVEELRDLQVEMIDRFGLLPEATRNLFAITELKVQAQPLGIRKIEAGNDGGRIIFDEQPRIDAAKIIQLVQKQPQVYRLQGQEKLRFSMKLPAGAQRVQAVARVLDAITP